MPTLCETSNDEHGTGTAACPLLLTETLATRSSPNPGCCKSSPTAVLYHPPTPPLPPDMVPHPPNPTPPRTINPPLLVPHHPISHHPGPTPHHSGPTPAHSWTPNPSPPLTQLNPPHRPPAQGSLPRMRSAAPEAEAEREGRGVSGTAHAHSPPRAGPWPLNVAGGPPAVRRMRGGSVSSAGGGVRHGGGGRPQLVPRLGARRVLPQVPPHPRLVRSFPGGVVCVCVWGGGHGLSAPPPRPGVAVGFYRPSGRPGMGRWGRGRRGAAVPEGAMVSWRAVFPSGGCGERVGAVSSSSRRWGVASKCLKALMANAAVLFFGGAGAGLKHKRFFNFKRRCSFFPPEKKIKIKLLLKSQSERGVLALHVRKGRAINNSGPIVACMCPWHKIHGASLLLFELLDQSLGSCPRADHCRFPFYPPVVVCSEMFFL